MSAKTNAEVVIAGKVYTLSGFESETYLQKVAGYINGKITEFEQNENYRRFSLDMKATLLELNIADDYFKAKDHVDRMEQDLQLKDQEVYDLKREIISLQLKLEDAENNLKQVESENQELLLNKARLEASLEDVLFGNMKSGDEVKETSFQNSPNHRKNKRR